MKQDKKIIINSLTHYFQNGVLNYTIVDKCVGRRIETVEKSLDVKDIEYIKCEKHIYTYDEFPVWYREYRDIKKDYKTYRYSVIVKKKNSNISICLYLNVCKEEDKTAETRCLEMYEIINNKLHTMNYYVGVNISELEEEKSIFNILFNERNDSISKVPLRDSIARLRKLRKGISNRIYYNTLNEAFKDILDGVKVYNKTLKNEFKLVKDEKLEISNNSSVIEAKNLFKIKDN